MIDLLVCEMDFVSDFYTVRDMKRHDDNDKFYFGSNRFFCLDGAWYFATRTGKDVGPYKDKVTAMIALDLFLRRTLSAMERKRDGC